MPGMCSLGCIPSRFQLGSHAHLWKVHALEVAGYGGVTQLERLVKRVLEHVSHSPPPDTVVRNSL